MARRRLFPFQPSHDSGGMVRPAVPRSDAAAPPRDERSKLPKGSRSTVSTEPVFKWWDYPVFAVLTGLTFATLAHFLLYWFGAADQLQHALTFWPLTLLLLGYLAINQFRWLSLPNMRRPKPMAPTRDWKVGVATTFVPAAESLDMLRQTLGALVAMDHPHETWVLDEGDDERVRALCRSLGAHHFTRKHLPDFQTVSGPFQARTKHGNYNAWLTEIGYGRYEIIAAFDPDHVPVPTFLSETLGYMEDPGVGMSRSRRLITTSVPASSPAARQKRPTITTPQCKWSVTRWAIRSSPAAITSTASRRSRKWEASPRMRQMTC